jgi:hypothetical protein
LETKAVCKVVATAKDRFGIPSDWECTLDLGENKLNWDSKLVDCNVVDGSTLTLYIDRIPEQYEITEVEVGGLILVS